MQDLQDRLVALGSETRENLVDAVTTLKNQDHFQARRIIATDEQVNDETIGIETDALMVIATQQPAASDLRVLASVIAIATELERINDYAKGIARITLLVGRDALLAPVAELPPMAAKASEMLARALQAFLKRDVDAAYAIHEEDDEVDTMYNHAYKELVAQIAADPEVMDQATHLLWAAHNLERTADRVSNICERVVFTVTGKMVEMPETEAEVPYPQE
jgi:phosphate transport system protein